MLLRSLGCRTDLIFHRFGGDVTDRGRYLVVRTPSNPTYRWGNFLIFDAPPGPGDFGRWTGLFGREVGSPDYQLFAWDTTDGEHGAVADFLKAGFSLSEEVVMAADTVLPPRRTDPGLAIRPLETDADFAAHVGLHVLCRDPAEAEGGYRAFLERKTASHRAMIRAGLGRCFGAFLDGQLVGDLGIFAGDGLARYQEVVTHPAFRRRGICRGLLYESGRFALETLRAETLVIVADEHYFAKDLYAAAGFTVRERQGSLERILGDD